MMKRTIVLGGIFVLVMMLALGMSPLNNQNCSGINCYMPCLMDDLPTYNKLVPYEGMNFERAGGPPEDRMVTDRRPPKGRGTPKLSGHSTQNVKEQFMRVVEEIDAELASQLKKICESDPEAFEIIIQGLRHRFGSLMQLRCSDPKLFDIKVTELKTDAEIYYFTEKMRELDFDAPDAAAQIAQLHGLVSAKTTLAISAQKLSIDRLERHLEGLKIQLAKTRKNFNSIVEGRVRVLIEIVQKGKRFELPRLK